MSRYFLEVSYKGSAYAGFQVQENAHTVQGAVEAALKVFLREAVTLTGSSRTDAGVHARQNFFHFDIERDMQERWMYNINAMLPDDIAVKSIRRVGDAAHCRFDAAYRRYRYMVYGKKDPFLRDMGYYYPFRIDVEVMRRAAELVKEYRHFETFAKRNTQVKTFECTIYESEWNECGGVMVYGVKANRFLRGMVRGLVGTMLQVGRGRMNLDEFRAVIESGDQARADFAVPGGGLCLDEVGFGEGYFG